MSKFEYIKKYYGVDCYIGQSVIVYGHNGVVTDDFGNYVGITLDGGCESARYHPADVTYLDNVIDEYDKLKKEVKM